MKYYIYVIYKILLNKNNNNNNNHEIGNYNK